MPFHIEMAFFLPYLMEKKIILKKGKEYSIKRFHPWIFSGAIDLIDDTILDGDLVSVYDIEHRFLCIGFFQHGSIAVRIIDFEKKEVNALFWQEKLQAALQLRHHLGLPSSTTNAYRLMHGEGDAIPGLIVDIYDDTAVIQAHSIGIFKERYPIAKAIISNDITIKRVYFKAHHQLPKQYLEEQSEGYLIGESKGRIDIKEYGCSFSIDVEQGQKTGFFLDQRENRRLLQQYTKGATVLNTFCYTGGFSVYALQNGAKKVISVDASSSAIEATKENLLLNGFTEMEHPCLVQDTFSYLDTMPKDIDVIILDPPAFAKHLSARHNALKGYQRLNAQALRNIKSGGILFTFSCSQVVDSSLFYNAIVAAAIETKRTIKVLHRLSQPADHPVSIYHPEGDYLKGLVLYVE